ncbi:MAG: 4Fe-4S dicluster domain-containing protein [Ruminococcus sp.]|nr:4Fe-4S dicluster domain-containing protein [Ruminococcus sp.]
MKEHYDVGIVGFWYGANYGSLLNGYAEYTILKGFGKEVLMIQKPNAKPDDPEITTGHNTDFIKKYYDADDITLPLPYAELQTLNNICDCFCAGSDQIWNYNISFHENMYLPFADSNKKLISFATSFGHKTDKTPDSAKGNVRKHLQRYSAISVREQFDVDILRENYGIKGDLVFEPVFCIDKKYYEQLANESSFDEKEPYLLTYILDPTPEKREAILYYAETLGIKTVNILDGVQKVWDQNNKALNIPGTLSNVSTEDFLKAFMNAKYVITDSFHGSAFSIIFNKPFMSIANHRRGYERFVDLLGRLNIMNRLVTDVNNIPRDIKYFEDIDYIEVNSIIEREAKRTIEWFKNAIETPKEKMESIILKSNDNAITSKLAKNKCVGCGACVSICPKWALSLQSDEYGYYRATIDNEKCVDCGLCSKKCPVLEKPMNLNTETPDCYEFIAADKDIVQKSSSGGAFSVMANEAFKRNGVVVGAAWRDDFSVEHIMIENESDMPKLRKSKYLQSFLGNGILRKVKSVLDTGRFVLFTGCPCQIAGLRKFLDKDYDNLVMVDLLCSHAPSEKFFKSYIDSLKKCDGAEINDYEFRYKSTSQNWDCTTIKFKSNEQEVVRRGAKEDNYQRAYHNHTMCSSHCENCNFQASKRYGDITMGDFWWIDKKDSAQKFESGVSALIINNEKGKVFVDSLSESDIGLMKQVPYEWLSGNGFTSNNKNYASPKRDLFYKSINKMSFDDAVDYALKPNHGVYPDSDKSFILNTSSQMHKFSFDRNVWEEHIINDKTVLITRQVKPSTGKYATLSLQDKLKSGIKYVLKIKFMIRTNDKVYNFHVKDSGSNIYNVIYSHKVNPDMCGKWIEKEIVFTPDADLYDEFMIGAAQLQGEDAYISFEYIKIGEEFV